VASIVGLVVVLACGSHDAKKRVRPDEAGGAAGERPVSEGAGGEATPGAGGEAGLSAGGAPANVGGGDAADLAGGAGGAPTSALACEDTCLDGACILDECVAVTTIAGDINLTTSPVTEGRACAEAPEYSVTALAPGQITLQGPVLDGCLEAGDELLLINLQGTPTETANVGNWELLHAESVAGNIVTLVTPKLRFYGSTLGSDANIGLVAGTQRVMLLRVPQFGKLVIGEGARVTAAAWDGKLGGVIALRARALSLAGQVDARQLGYRAGRSSDDDDTCSDSVATEAGESIGGLGGATTLRNNGGSGGLTAGNVSFQFNNPVMATPGHASNGEPGTNGQTRTIGQPGLAYGTNDGTRLTMGSGPGGELKCSRPPGAAAALVATPGQAGGIALLLADELSVEATGSVDASPPDAVRDIAFSGGYVLMRGQRLDLGPDRVLARGSVGHGANTLVFENAASPGYIVADAAIVSGTTNPPVTVLH
jgi:hypothetical protein